jgi:hypothetical protein
VIFGIYAEFKEVPESGPIIDGIARMKSFTQCSLDERNDTLALSSTFTSRELFDFLGTGVVVRLERPIL